MMTLWKTVLLTWALFLSLSAHSSAYAITGISAGVNIATGERPFRLEINDFASSGAAWDLFILAFQQFQQTNQSDPLSYFQIAGIHGFPQVPWDSVNGTGDYPGYCMHAAVPFSTWHRPYVALFEQVLWSHAQTIARSYPLDQQASYTAAAVSLRMPYWDWAANPALPYVVTTPTITINSPEGLREVDNPLFNYTFQSEAVGNGFPSGGVMSDFPWTVRSFNTTIHQSNNTDSTRVLLYQAPTILSQTYQLLTSVTNYTSMACVRTAHRNANIEGIHNSIHNSIGGYGHMTFPEFAAFDPIFFLHHANVDRIFAIWQAIHPDSYVEPVTNTYGSYFEDIGFIDSATSGLAPFHSDNQSTLWTSESVRSTRTFGYTYPEVIDWATNTTNVTNATSVAESARAKVNALYNPSAGSHTRRKRDESLTTTVQGFNHVTFDMARELGVNNLDQQWTIFVQVQRYALPTTFTIDFFLGEPPADSRGWSTAPNLIGSHAQFISGNVSLLKSDGLPGGLHYGEVSMTHTLAAGVARGVLTDLSPPSVVPVLASGLHWRAKLYDGCEVDASELRDLSILVGSRKVQPATSMNEFPIFDVLLTHVEATHGKVGGAQDWQHRG